MTEHEQRFREDVWGRDFMSTDIGEEDRACVESYEYSQVVSFGMETIRT